MLDKVASATNYAEGRKPYCRRSSPQFRRCGRNTGKGTAAVSEWAKRGSIRIGGRSSLPTANNLPFLENFPVRDELERRLGNRVILENDANAAALGEKWMGAGREVDDLVLLTLGTGDRRRHHRRGARAARLSRHGRRVGPHHGGSERQPVRLRQSRLLGKTRVGDLPVTAMARLMQLGENVSSKDLDDLARRAGRGGRQSARHLVLHGSRRWASRWRRW